MRNTNQLKALTPPPGAVSMEMESVDLTLGTSLNLMTPITGIESLQVGQDFAVPRMEQTAGSGLQSKSSAESPSTKKAAAVKAVGNQPKGKTTVAASAGGQSARAPETESRPMEPSRVIEVQFFKDGVFGAKQKAKRQATTRHIDLDA